MARRYGYYTGYEPTRPKKVTGGIKAQSRRGSFADSWWGKRWLQALENFNIGARLSRGRSYARKGQVARLEIGKGRVSAQVQGSRSGAYGIAIELKVFTPKQWQQIIEQLVEQPIFAAQLLGNEMPEDIETVFSNVGLSLFPQKSGDLRTDCSCPDWSNPCKHIAAVFYLMAEAFDQDPFLLFRLRGIEREEFLVLLKDSGAAQDLPPEESEAAPKLEPEPLPLDNAEFWGENPQYAPPAKPYPPTLHAALPRRLGNLPFWRSEQDFIQQMEAIYQAASQHLNE